MMVVSRLLARGDTFECYAVYEGRRTGTPDTSGLETA
jgi:hypothetical protein